MLVLCVGERKSIRVLCVEDLLERGQQIRSSFLMTREAGDSQTAPCFWLFSSLEPLTCFCILCRLAGVSGKFLRKQCCSG